MYVFVWDYMLLHTITNNIITILQPVALATSFHTLSASNLMLNSVSCRLSTQLNISYSNSLQEWLKNI